MNYAINAMEESFNVAVDLLCVVLSLAFSIWVLYRWIFIKNSCRQSRLPPGDKTWPLIGDTLRWYFCISGSHPPSFVENHVRRHGQIFACNLFGRPTVVSADPKFNLYILQNEGRLFKASYPKSFRDLVGKKGLIAIHGDLQRKLHGIAVNLMNSDKLKNSLLTDIQIILQRTVNTWKDREMLFEDECRKLAINLMANQLMGVSTEKEINEMALPFSDFVHGILSIPIKIPGSSYYKAMKARSILISKIYKTIDERKKNPNGPTNNGLLTRLLNEENFSEEIVADFIISLLFAGHETTAKTMLFAIHFLTHCPKALEELTDEHESLRKNKNDQDQMLTWDDYKAMNFTQCVINETLRLGGIAISVFRETTHDIQVKDYIIPKGWFVLPFLSAVHLNEDSYTGALSFDPWRWSGDKDILENKYWKNSELFMPFGAGARFCPGADVARLQISLFLHHFVTKYRWKQLKEDRISYFPSARMVGRFPILLQGRHIQSSAL